MSEAAYQPNQFKRPPPLPDEIQGSPIYLTLSSGERVKTGHVILRPNEPAPETEPMPDKRPDRLLEAAGFDSAEVWGNSILAKKNGK